MLPHYQIQGTMCYRKYHGTCNQLESWFEVWIVYLSESTVILLGLVWAETGTCVIW